MKTVRGEIDRRDDNSILRIRRISDGEGEIHTWHKQDTNQEDQP